MRREPDPLDIGPPEIPALATLDLVDRRGRVFFCRVVRILGLELFPF